MNVAVFRMLTKTKITLVGNKGSHTLSKFVQLGLQSGWGEMEKIAVVFKT